MQKGFVSVLSVLGLFCSHVVAQPVITQNPTDRAATPGAVVSFAVGAEGSSPLRYQWQFNGTDLPNATGRILRMVASPTRAGIYSVRVADATGNERRSAPAKLQVMRRPVITVQPRNTIVGVHDTATFSVSVNDSGPYTRMIWHNSNPLEGSHEIPPQAADGVNTTTLVVEDCADNDSYNGIYWFAVTNSVGGTVSRRVRLTVIGPPQFTAEPQDRAVRQGGYTSFSVSVRPDGAPWRTYQWFFEDRPIPGATSRYLRLSKIQPDQAGFYSCAVTTIGGTTESYGALLTVY